MAQNKINFNAPKIGWLLYDPANSAYALLVRTLYATIFFSLCAKDILSQAQITSSWAMTASAAGLLAGVISVLCGPVADAKCKRKLMLLIFSLLGILSILTYTILPHNNIRAILLVSLIGIASFMAANSFYDSLLPVISAPAERDKLSTLGYASGYVGGLLAFIPCFFLRNMETFSMFNAVFFIAAVWWAVGTVPLLCTVRETTAGAKYYSLKSTFKYIWHDKNILCYLAAYFLFIDGVGTILLAATPLASGLQISSELLLVTILALQLIGLPFTLLYGYLAEKFSARTMIWCAIAVYVLIAVLTTIMALLDDLMVRQILFGAVAFLVGTSQGGIQSLSRSLYSKIIPPARSAELFSVYNIFGKFTTIVGPVFIYIATKFSGRAEFGITMLIVPFLLGAWLLGRVKLPDESSR